MITATVDELACRLALWQVAGIGPKRFRQLLRRFSSATAVFTATTEELRQLGLTHELINRLTKPNWRLVERTLTWLENDAHHLLCFDDPAYPPRLNEIAASPPILYLKGQKDLLPHHQLAIVGSRNPTPVGLLHAARFASFLAHQQILITSGLALGIDTAAHRGALEAKGRTIAVVGTGLDVIYPKRNQQLALEIEQNGAILSELPLGTQPMARNFPRRNRLISGLSQGVLVVEAALKSGSLITAKYALEQNREVFAIPSSIHNPLARGCHALLKQGAKLVETAADILEELNTNLVPEQKTHRPEKMMKKLDCHQQKLVECLAYEVTTTDTLIARTGFASQTVSQTLIELELMGLIKAVTGGYMRINL